MWFVAGVLRSRELDQEFDLVRGGLFGIEAIAIPAKAVDGDRHERAGIAGDSGRDVDLDPGLRGARGEGRDGGAPGGASVESE